MAAEYQRECELDLEQQEELLAELAEQPYVQLNFQPVAEALTREQLLAIITTSQQTLKKLNLTDCTFLQASDLLEIAEKCAHLEVLVLKNNPNLEHVGKFGMFSDSPITFNQLKVIDIQDCSNIDTVYLVAPELEAIRIANILARAVKAESQSNELTTVCLRNCGALQEFSGNTGENTRVLIHNCHLVTQNDFLDCTEAQDSEIVQMLNSTIFDSDIELAVINSADTQSTRAQTADPATPTLAADIQFWKSQGDEQMLAQIQVGSKIGSIPPKVSNVRST